MQAVVWIRPLLREMVCFHPWPQLSAAYRVEMWSHKILASCVALKHSQTGCSTKVKRSVLTLPSRCSWTCLRNSQTKLGHRSPRTTWQINSRGRFINNRGRRDTRDGTNSTIGSLRDSQTLGMYNKRSLRVWTGLPDWVSLLNTLRSQWLVWLGLWVMSQSFMQWGTMD